MNEVRSFDINKERSEQDGSEYLFGALSQPGLFNVPLNEREKWLAPGQLQFSNFADYQDCATRAPLNALKAQLDYAYKNGLMHPDNAYWYMQNGYTTCDLSNRFNAVLSGTTKQGNSLKAPLQSIHSDGVIPQNKLPEQGLTWEQYHDKKAITPEMIALGKEFARRFTVTYEKVHRSHFPVVASDDFICCALYAWPVPENGIYPSPGSLQPTHAVAIFKPRYFVIDNYLDQNKPDDFIKQLAENFTFYEEGYRIFVSAENPVPDAQLVSLYQKLVSVLITLRDYLVANPQTPTPQPTPRTNAEKLYEAAKSCLGTDASPSDSAPDELGCAETWNEIYKKAFGSYLYEGNRNATFYLYKALRESPKFKEVTEPLAGDTVISPTGYGRNMAMPNGHVGIVMEQGIASNDSRTGKFEINYTLGTWKDKYVKKGLYPCKFYRPL